MPQLLIQCRYLAHSYTGVRQDQSRRDELDWPPAPARLHQAFIASTLANLPDALREEFAGKILAALRWLETLPPPDVIASRLADDSGHRRALHVAMPHNSPAKGDFAGYHSDLAPVLRATPDGTDPLFAAYRWADDAPEFSRAAGLHLAALRDAAAKLRYLGRAEDRVECEVVWHPGGNQEPVSDLLEVWHPSARPEVVTLLTARPQSTDQLMEEFKRASERRAREAKRPARLFLREQAYAPDAAAGLLPVHVAIFQILRDSGDPDQLPEVCDAIHAHRWRSPIRALACKLAEDRDRWNDPALAEELISGHVPGGGHTQQPHLAFVPLPSISLHGKADGRVRRFALLGYANEEKAAAADSIYRTLAASLDGEEIETGYRLRQVVDPLRNDKVWPLYAGSSRCWASVTPVAIDRGYKVPTHSQDGRPLSSNERHLRRLAEWTLLLRASLRHIRLPTDLVESCEVLLSPSPFLRATERAERYRAKDDHVPFVHARIEFARAVRGPVLVGDRRYLGLGLLVPA